MIAAVRTVRCPTCGTLHAPAPPGRVDAIETRALRALAGDLAGCREDLWRFLRLAIEGRVTRGGALAGELALPSPTLRGRFRRAGLPTPKQYVVGGALIRVADLRDRGVPFERASVDNGYATAQSLARAFRSYFGLTQRALTHDVDGDAAIERFRERLVLPYRDQLLAFSPCRRGR